MTAVLHPPDHNVQAMPSISELLNPEQLEAVIHPGGPLLVIAGAGSGKTRVLTYRIAHLVQDLFVSPSSILAMTFTNKATAEMRERVHQLLGNEGKMVWVATFHSMATTILRRHAEDLGYKKNFTIYDDNECRTLLRSLIKARTGKDREDSTAGYRYYIDQCKMASQSPADVLAKAAIKKERDYAEVYRSYQEHLFANNAMDFGDLLFNLAKLFEASPEVRSHYQRRFTHILVDEFQDTNQIQYKILRQILNKDQNITAVGDDDQSIYGFRGADVSTILNFEKYFPGCKQIYLEQNYRSTSNILDVANSLIKANQDRKKKNLWTSEAGGERVTIHSLYDPTEESAFVKSKIKQLLAQGYSFKDIAIFYRTNAQSRALEESLIANKIPYKIYGGLKFYDRKEIKDIICYLRLANNHTDSQAFFRTINTPPRGIGTQTLAKIEATAAANAISLFQATQLIASEHKGVSQFVQIIGEIIKSIKTNKIPEVIEKTLKLTNYIEKIPISDRVGAETRLENINELIAVAATLIESFDGSNFEDSSSVLSAFLDRCMLNTEEVSLAEQEGDQKVSADSVSLMSLHLAKGLEFPVVFVTGLEEGLLPHNRSLSDSASIEEERRLLYVGITRARRCLYLTLAENRGFGGGNFAASSQRQAPSRFIRDIPRELIETNLKQRSSHLEAYGYQKKLEDTQFQASTNSRSPSSSSTYSSLQRSSEATRNARELLDRVRSGKVKLEKTAIKIGTDLSDTDIDGPIVTVTDLKVGMRVYHRTFGPGTLLATSGERQDPATIMLEVQFDIRNTTKRLSYVFAKLRPL